MDPGLVSNYLLWAAVAVVVIVRQFVPRRMRLGTMLVLPLVAGYLGVQALIASPPDGAAALGLLGVNLFLGAAMGVVRGATVRIWPGQDGGWMMQGTVLTFAFWLVSIGLRIALGFAGHGAVSLNELPLFMGVTFVAQAVVVWLRTQTAAPAASPARSR